MSDETRAKLRELSRTVPTTEEEMLKLENYVHAHIGEIFQEAVHDAVQGHFAVGHSVFGGEGGWLMEYFPDGSQRRVKPLGCDEVMVVEKGTVVFIPEP